MVTINDVVCRSRRLAAVKLIAIAAFVSLSVADARAEGPYLLQPGDTVRLEIFGIPDAVSFGTVDIDGGADLGMLGRISLAGKTIEEARREAQTFLGGRAFRRFGTEGEPLVLTVSSQDVRLSVESYRPVNVTGLVANPGRFEFEPGMTARAVIAQAGGIAISTTGTTSESSLDELVKLNAALDKAYLREAAAQISVWAMQASLDENIDLPLPEGLGERLPASVTDRMLEDATRRVSTSIAGIVAERDFIRNSLEQAQERASILIRQRTELGNVLDADESEAARLEQLVERGVAPAARLVEMRRAMGLSAKNLLDVEEALSGLRLDMLEFEHDLGDLEKSRRIDLLEGLEEARTDLFDAAKDVLREQELIALQSLSNGAGVSSASSLQTPVVLRVFRNMTGETVELTLPIDAYVRPGDVIEVQYSVKSPQQGN